MTGLEEEQQVGRNYTEGMSRREEKTTGEEEVGVGYDNWRGGITSKN